MQLDCTWLKRLVGRSPRVLLFCLMHYRGAMPCCCITAILDSSNCSVQECVYHSVDSLKNPEEAALYPAEFLHSLTPSGLPPHELRLKPGAPIMLLRNINAAAGLANGTRLVVERLTSRVIVAKIASGSRAGSSVFIPRFTMAPSDQDPPFELQRRQFPVRPAFAMSINKAQGQTMTKAGVYLPKPVFTHGQLYVAFSRVGSSIGCVCAAAEGAQGTYTKNIVYTEVLL